MSETSHISIAAFVSENERTAVQLAAGQIAQALSQAAKTPWTCDPIFVPDMEALQKENDAAIFMTSLVPELRKGEEPWPVVEKRLRKAYAALCERGNPVFICTILRHVDGRADADGLRIHIRRLNLLAAEISRETGAYVIDIDRVLANAGARWLQTDYRLGGNAAVEIAGHFIALTLINNAFDALVSFEIQDGAREILAANRPETAKADTTKVPVTIKQDLRSMGQGRRKQTVLPVVYTDREVYAGWFLRQVLRGRIGPAEVIHRMREVVRLHGVRESAVLVASLLFRQLQRRK
jgi:hypothetical protein